MLIRNTLLYLPAQIIGPTAQFFAILAFTHWMAPEAYGVFTYVIASQDFVFTLCLSWWSQYTMRYLTGHAAQALALYHRSETTIVAGTIVVQIATSLLALLLISVPISPLLATATVFYTVTRCLNLHLGERARAQNRILDYTLAQSAGPVGGLAVAVIAMSQWVTMPAPALLAYAAVQAVALVWLTRRQGIRLALRRPDRGLLGQALAFGLPLIAAGVAVWIGMNAIRVLVDHHLGAATMGLVAVGWGLGHRVTASAAMFVTAAAYPLAVESFRAGSRQEAFRQITMNGLLMFGIVFPAAVGLFLIQEPLVTLFVAQPFRAMTLQILPAALFAGLCRNIRTHVADQVFVLIEQTAMVFTMTVMEAVLAVTGCVLGLLLDGARGAATGSAAGFGFAMIVSFGLARTRAGLHVPILDAALIMIAAGTMALVLTMLPGDLVALGPRVSIALRVVVGVLVYILAILLLFPALTRNAWSRWRQQQAT